MFVSKALKLDPKTTPTVPLFDDIATSPFFSYIQLGAETGLFAGCSVEPKKFCPDDPTTRGQAAAVIYQVLTR